MIILGILAVITVLGVIILINDTFNAVGFIATVFGGVLLFVAFITIPIRHMDVNQKIAEYKALSLTIETARVRGDNFENAALQHKIADINMQLASLQYYNGTVVDIWIPDAIDKLQPIK
jgi:hypothetical protein